MIKYVITHRIKTQTNKKRNHVTEADFQYCWSNTINENTVFSKSPQAERARGFDYFNSLAEAQQSMSEGDWPYGHRIWKVELVEEHKKDIAYQPNTDKVTF